VPGAGEGKFSPASEFFSRSLVMSRSRGFVIFNQSSIILLVKIKPEGKQIINFL